MPASLADADRVWLSGKGVCLASCDLNYFNIVKTVFAFGLDENNAYLCRVIALQKLKLLIEIWKFIRLIQATSLQP